MYTSDSENDEVCTSPDVLEAAETNSVKLLPEISRKKYEAVYKTFMDWRSSKKVNSFSENVFLEYFGELSEKYKSSSLWSQYSMLRSTLNLNNNINIENYSRLRALLKRKAVGYQAKKAKTFTPYEINKFINEAPDNPYLATKVALIMGVMGSCRRSELHDLNIENIQDLGSAMLVTIANTNTKTVRKFTITDHFYTICKKYADLRPTNPTSMSFFLNYQNGKCTVQNIGKNKFGAMGKEVAKFLQLPNPEMYTAHSFRKSSASLLVNADGNITALKKHSGWKFTSIATEYLDDSVKNEMDTNVTTVQQTGTNTQQTVISQSESSQEAPSISEEHSKKRVCIHEPDNVVTHLKVKKPAELLPQYTDDNDQIFGNYVASELRQLRYPENKRRLKHLINEAIKQISEADAERYDSWVDSIAITTNQMSPSPNQSSNSVPLFSSVGNSFSEYDNQPNYDPLSN